VLKASEQVKGLERNTVQQQGRLTNNSYLICRMEGKHGIFKEGDQLFQCLVAVIVGLFDTKQ